MTQFVPALTILFVFIATGNPLRCLECTHPTKGFCKGESLKCPSTAKFCIKTLEITKIGDTVYKSFSRACTNDEHKCGQDFIMNSGHDNKQMRVITECCNSDNCNKCKVNVPQYNTTLNKLLCPVCYKYKSYNCESQGYIACTGNQVECIDIASTIQKEGFPVFKFSLMGCITEQGCSLGPKIIETSKIIDAKRFSCSKAVPITH